MKSKTKKPFYKRWWFVTLIVLMLIGAIGDLFDGEEPEGTDSVAVANNLEEERETEEAAEEPEQVNEPEYKSLSNEQIQLLEKTYTDFTDDEMKTFTTMIKDWGLLSKEDQNIYDLNYSRLIDEKREYELEQARIKREEREKAEAEAKAKAEAEAAEQWEIFIAENTKTLGAGTFYAPDHISVGVYDVSFTGAGNLFINGNEGLEYNEIGGSSYGVSKIRVYITESAEIEISGMKVNFVPVQRTQLPSEGFTLYAGYWSGADEIPSGRYEVTPGSGESGNFFVMGSNYVNEILGGSYGVESVTINITEKDIVNIRGMESVTFTPTN